jgi:hypothetical protein
MSYCSPGDQAARGSSKRKDVFKYPGTGKRVVPDNQVNTEGIIYDPLFLVFY